MKPVVIKVAKGLVSVAAIVLPFVDNHIQAKGMQTFMSKEIERQVAEALKKK